MKPPLSSPAPRRPRPPSPDTLAVEILGFLGGDTERFERFLALSGLSLPDLRGIAGSPAFTESLLDHLCSDERLLVLFAEEKGYDPSAIEAVRQSLSPPPFD